MKKLIILTAPPGSGKSTFTKRFLSKHPNTFVISSDNIRFELTNSYTDFSKQDKVWETFEDRLNKYTILDGDYYVILDALNDTNELRRKYAQYGKKFDECELVILKKDKDFLISNNSTRTSTKQIPNDIFMGLLDKFEDIDEETSKEFDKITVIEEYFK